MREDLCKSCNTNCKYKRMRTRGIITGCAQYTEKQTYADKIRKMSDEELLKFQVAVRKAEGCPPSNPDTL